MTISLKPNFKILTVSQTDFPETSRKINGEFNHIAENGVDKKINGARKQWHRLSPGYESAHQSK